MDLVSIIDDEWGENKILIYCVVFDITDLSVTGYHCVVARHTTGVASDRHKDIARAVGRRPSSVAVQAGVCGISRGLDPHAARRDPRVLCKATATHCSFRISYMTSSY